jgi:hypothetical protein
MASKFFKFKQDISSLKKDKSLGVDIIDQGIFGDLNYTIYKRGVIKISSDESDLVFKKDINLFENEIANIDFESMVEPIIIKGSGDNDHLVFSKINNDIKISLKGRVFSSVEILCDIISKGKKKLGGQNKKVDLYG